MPYVDFRTAAVGEFGLPQACPCCGNDDDGRLSLQDFYERPFGAGQAGCCMISIFLGPVGWVFGMISLLLRGKKLPFPLPICNLCRQAKSRLDKRFFAAFFLGALTIGSTFYHPNFPQSLEIGYLAAVGMLLAFLEYSSHSRQFRLQARTSNADGALVYVPYEEYPALYQRHLDNAVLYGSTDQLGAPTE